MEVFEEEEVEEGKYECPVCEERFFTLAGKKKHIRNEHPRGA